MSSNPATFGSEFTQEIRFAVVIYGGSSLAIYMNGVAQELLHLVRATAPGKTPGSLHVDKVSGTERVYRELGRMLDRGKAPKTKLEPQDNIKTRFIIDILSGTSAGGINSVFLAKALANDLELTSLRNIWLDTADFDVLLNDNGGEGAPQKPPKSLVNSPYLYNRILNALKDMDLAGQGKPSPYSEQIDLYTTFTDIQGQTVALKLADLVAAERQHLHNFHFTYSTEAAAGVNQNDFSPDYNPFLAFAARCTSAHPAAFEPMALQDIELEQCDPANVRWKKFYAEYLQPVRVERKSKEEPTSEKLAAEFLKRPLSDGGVLDNSPFSFAIDQLDFRNVKLPVDRKLIYVEPSPDHPELDRDANVKPDFIQNAILSLSSLPSYQFIRDDIRRILERNRLIDRVNRILNGMEEDFEGTDLKTFTGEEFKNASMDELLNAMGPSWGSYQRLRVEETTDDLVSIVARAAGIDDDADEILALQFLVMAWRKSHYMTRPPQDDPNKTYKTENEFLYDFDLKRHIRRLKFVIRKANELSCFDKRAVNVAAIVNEPVRDIWEEGREKAAFQALNRKELEDIIAKLSDVLKELYVMQRNLNAPLLSFDKDAPTNPLAGQIASFNIDRFILWSLLEQPSHAARLDAAAAFVRQHEKEFEALADALRKQLGVKIHAASGKVKGEAGGEGKGILPIDLTHQQALDSPQVAATPQALLRYYYNHFDHFDMGSYPIIYSTNAGEELDPVEVFRIGPEDSDTPIQDKDARKRKLAGLSLGHFGALLDRPYRVNDIIWGRLDCADRLITALIRSAPAPEPDDVQRLEETRKRLIREAQEAIIIEETESLNEQQRSDLGLVYPTPATGELEKRASAIAEVDRSSMPDPIKELLKARLREEDPLTRFVKNFHQLHKENPHKLLETAGRGSRILGRMLDDVADQRNFNSPHLSWITRLMRIFWGMVEVSLPDRWAHILTVHLLKLLYLFEVLMIVGGIFLSSNAVQRFGFLAIAITLAIHCLILILRDFTLKRTTWARATVGVLGAVVIFAALLGIVMLGGVVGIDPVWRMVQYLHDTIAGT